MSSPPPTESLTTTVSEITLQVTEMDSNKAREISKARYVELWVQWKTLQDLCRADEAEMVALKEENTALKRKKARLVQNHAEKVALQEEITALKQKKARLVQIHAELDNPHPTEEEALLDKNKDENEDLAQELSDLEALLEATMLTKVRDAALQDENTMKLKENNAELAKDNTGLKKLLGAAWRKKTLAKDTPGLHESHGHGNVNLGKV